MGKAWIDGAEVPYGHAVSAAALRLAESRLPLVTGLQTDVAGVRAAIALAKAVGGVVDHGGSEALYSTLGTLRASGMFLGTPAEMRRRADRFLVVGKDAASLAPELLRFLFGGTGDLRRSGDDGGARKIVWLGAAKDAVLPTNGIVTETIDVASDDIAGAIGMIRASLGGRRFGEGGISAEKAAELGQWLSGAGFACVVWSAPGLDAMTAEMLAGLVADLNLSTRATGLPLHGAGQAYGAAQVATWLCGYPLRTSFARGAADHDPWAFAAHRLVSSGESDLCVHVSALAGVGAAEPEWAGLLPTIALGSDPSSCRNPPAIAFEVSVAGRDHPGVLYRDETASFVAFEAETKGDAPSAAEVLGAILDALPDASAERAA